MKLDGLKLPTSKPNKGDTCKDDNIDDNVERDRCPLKAQKNILYGVGSCLNFLEEIGRFWEVQRGIKFMM